MSKVNNNMFSISEVKRKFYDVKTDSITTNGYNHNYDIATNDVCKYDLPNNNIYTTDGELFELADDVSVNTSFLLYLIHAKILDVEPFLNYQFSNTPDKKAFLDYTEYGIASDKFIGEGKGKLICEWVKTQRATLKNYNTEKIELNNSNTLELKAIFNDKNNAYEVCINLLDDLEITIDAKPNMKAGRAGKLIGLISAIKETPAMLKLEKPTDELLLRYFNSHLNTSYITFGKRSEDYSNSKDDAKRYIKNNFKK
jgi:hypothetical protein